MQERRNGGQVEKERSPEISRTDSGVAQTAALMAVLTLGTKFLGFLREIFLAGFFGTSPVTDAYVMAAAIPGILFAGVFTSMSVSYMPLYSDIVAQEGRDAGNRFTSQAIMLSSGLAVAGAVLGILFTEQLVHIFAAGFDADTAALTVFYAKITFFYIVFNAAAGLFESYLQYDGAFLRPLLAGYLQSGLVLAAIVVSAYLDYRLLALGLLIGTVLRTIALAAFAVERGFEWSPGGKISDAAKAIVALAIPVFIGSTVNQINTFVDKMLASGLVSGSVSALNYSYLLVNMITALTTAIIVTIIYPRLTRAQSSGDATGFDRACQAGVSVSLIIAVPFSLGAALYSEPVIRLVYERGAFDAASRSLTVGAFAFYSLGLVFVAVNALLVKVFYSLQDMKAPVAAGAVAALTNIGLNLLFVGPLAQRGLALATSIAALVNTVCLVAMLRRRHPATRVFTDPVKAAKIVAAACAAVFLSWLVYKLPGRLARLLLRSMALSLAPGALASQLQTGSHGFWNALQFVMLPDRLTHLPAMDLEQIAHMHSESLGRFAHMLQVIATDNPGSLHSAILLLLAAGSAALVYLFLLYKLDIEELGLLKSLVKK